MLLCYGYSRREEERKGKETKQGKGFGGKYHPANTLLTNTPDGNTDTIVQKETPAKQQQQRTRTVPFSGLVILDQERSAAGRHLAPPTCVTVYATGYS